MPFYRNRLIKRGMFSLLQAALVVTALVVVGSIVGPRITRAAHSPGHLPDQLLIGHLKALRTAISDYAAEHAEEADCEAGVHALALVLEDLAGRP